MPAKSSGSRATDMHEAAGFVETRDFTRAQRLCLLAINAIPLVHVTVIALVLSLLRSGAWWRILGALAVLYLVPPLLCRAFLFLHPIREGKIVPGSRDYFFWWFTLNLQILFCRFPFLEETLRLVPGLYSAWLRLWGAKIGRFTYWAAGTFVIERSFLEIGDDVVFGAGVRLTPHVLARDVDGESELMLGTIKIGDRAMIGAYSLLTAGTEIAADESTRAHLLSPPFCRWKNGKRVRER